MDFQLYELNKNGVLKRVKLQEGDMVEIQSHGSGGRKVVTVAFFQKGRDCRLHNLVTSNRDNKVLLDSGISEETAISEIRQHLAGMGWELHFLNQDVRRRTLMYLIRRRSDAG